MIILNLYDYIKFLFFIYLFDVRMCVFYIIVHKFIFLIIIVSCNRIAIMINEQLIISQE